MMTDMPSEAEIEKAWRNAKPALGRDPRLYRIAPDIIQSMIRRDRYNICGEYGWRVEHGKPVSFRKTSIEEAMKLVQHEMHTPTRSSKTRSNSSRKN